jgi:hypothetical protein
MLSLPSTSSLQGEVVVVLIILVEQGQVVAVQVDT